MAKILTQEEYDGVAGEKKPSGFKILSQEEYEEAMIDKPTVGDYLRAIPATGADITIGATEGLASAIGSVTGDYDLARNIAEIRTDVNDVIMGDAPESVKSDFAYKLASGLGSTLPYLAAAIVSRRGDMIAKVAANGFFLASAGQQVRDDYLGTQGITSENATDEQMAESNKAGAIGAIPIALAEKLGAGMILRPFSKGPIPAGKVMERIAQYTSAGLGEAATEVTQSGIINAISAYVSKYDPNRPITQGMAESAVIGFLVGGGVNAGIDTVDRAMTQSDRLEAGVKDGSINAKDVIDPDIGGPMAEIAMQNGSIPEAESLQQLAVTDPNSFKEFASKVLTPISRRLGRAGKEVVREFRNFERNTGVKITEYKKAVNPFSQQMIELRKKSPEDYRLLSLALANANELATSLPDSVQKSMEKKAQTQPEILRSSGEQLLDTTNANAQIINTQIEQARKSLADRGLKTQVVVSESGNSFYDPSTNTISISATEADGTTVAHEYFHAVLGQAVKTDVELQSMTRNMFDSVIRASVKGSSLNEQLQGFVSQYDTNIQNEEFLAQTVGELARQYQTLDINTRTRVKVWINQVMQALGMQGAFKQAETDAEVIEQLNAFARFSGETEALTEGVSRDTKDGIGGPISAPIRGSKLQIKDLTQAPRVDFDLKPRKNSNVDSSDSFDMLALLDDIVTNNLTVTFWGADQMGIGNYKSPVSGKKYFLDAGLGFAKNKKGKAKDYVWSSTQAGAVKAASKSDVVMIFSGDPETMHYFNKVPATIFYDNIISKYGSVEKFAKTILAKEDAQSQDIAMANKFLNEYADPDTVINNSNGKLKRIFMESIRSRLDSTNSNSVRKILEELMPSNADLVDAHLTHNEFGLRDIYAAFKPNGNYTAEKTTGIHNTYEYGIAGEFLGTPDIKVNLEDIIETNFLNELKEKSYEEYLYGKEGDKGTASKIGKVTKKGIAIPDMETAKSTARGYGLNVAKLTGGATGAKTFKGKQFRTPTPKQVADAIERNKKPATAEQMARGAKRIRKNQKVRGTQAFRKWFGDGVLKHEDGEAMVLYHGTKEDITEFKGSNPNLKDWVFFSTDPELSSEMAMRKPIRVDLEKTVEKVEDDFAELSDSEVAELAAEYFSRPHDPQDSLLPDRLIARQEYERKRMGMEGVDFVDLGGINVMPAYLNAKKIFDPRNEEDIDYLMRSLENYRDDLIDFREENNDFTSGSEASIELEMVQSVIRQGRTALESGFYGNYELEFVSDALKRGKYDGVILSEIDSARDPNLDDRYNLTTVAVWNGASGIKSATGNTGAYSSSEEDIRYQKSTGRFDRSAEQIATEEEMIRGLSDEGMAILQQYGMVDNYRQVRTILNTIKEEYQTLGLDSNFIDNYFPRLVQDLEGLKKSFGMPTGIVDQEIRRYENMTGQTLSGTERQMMYEKLARSKLYRGGVNDPSNIKERRISLIGLDQLGYYASPELALDSYLEKMVNAIETKKLIGDAASGKTQGAEAVSGRLGEVMDGLAKQGRLRQDQIEVIQGAVAARFGQHGRQYGFVKGVKNAGYLATMGNPGSALTQLGDFYFTMVQNGLIPTIESVMGRKEFTIEDLGLAKDMVSIENEQGAGMFANSVRTVFRLTGLTAMDRLAKNTNINAAYKVMTRGAKAGQNTNKYKKTLARLKRTQGDDAYKTIADLKNGVKSDLVVEALYNELADVAPISLTEMPENYAANPNLRILYSLKSYTIKQFNFLREKTYVELTEGIVNKDPKRIAGASVNMMRILAFSALANGSADVLKAILFNREIDEEDFMWNTLLRMFGVTKYTAVVARNQGVGDALISFIAPPQFGIVNDITKDIGDLNTISEMRSSKYFPLVGKIYYWQGGKGVEVEEKLSRLRD